jgi:hypothetical protein
VFVITGPNTEGITLFLENTDTTNYIQYRTQVSNTPLDSDFQDLPSDGDSATVAIKGNFGTYGILTPMNPTIGTNRVMISIRTSAPYTRIIASASGGALLNYGIVMQMPSNSTNFTPGTM